MKTFKDPLGELYKTLSNMDIKDPHFDVIVHAIQEIQQLRSWVEAYMRATRTNPEKSEQDKE